MGGTHPWLIRNHSEILPKNQAAIKKCGNKRSNFSNIENKYAYLHIVTSRM